MRSAIPFLGLLVAGVAVVDGASSCFDDKCDSGTQYINIYSCGLTDDDIPDLAACFDEAGRDNIVSLYLDDNELTTLPADLFQGLESLVQLSLADNWLGALAPGLFDELEKLVSLSLGENDLTTLPEGLFDHLGSLTYMSFLDNNLSALPRGVFDGLSKLKTLYLTDNLLTTLPQGLFNDVGSLNTLDLRGNPDLQCIPTNVATSVNTDPISFDQCECSPSEAVLCDEGLYCVPGDYGYNCVIDIAAMAMHKLGGELHYPDVRSKGSD